FWTVLEHRAIGASRRRLLHLARALDRCPPVVRERRALIEESPWRRELSARRLSLLPSPRSRRALRSSLARGPEVGTWAALEGLARVRDARGLRWFLEHPESLAGRDDASLAALLRGFGRRAAPILAQLLAGAHVAPRLERAAIEALGWAGHRPAAAAIAR